MSDGGETPGPSPPAEPSAAYLLEELRRSRQAQEDLVRQFNAFKTDTDVKIANLAAEAASAKAKAKATASDSDDDDDAVYCEYQAHKNPFPTRPKTCGLKPKSFDLYGDRTADALEAKSNSSLRWEYRTLAPSLSYFYDAKAVYDSLKNDVLTALPEDQSLALEATFNTLDGVYSMLNDRHAIIKIRTRAEGEPGGMSEENKLLLAYLDTKLHSAFPGDAITDSKVDVWLEEFRDRRASAELKAAANKGASKTRSSSPTTSKPKSTQNKNRATAKKKRVGPKAQE